MTFEWILAHTRISTKLLLLNAMICSAFLMIVCIVFFSFSNLQNMLMEITERDMEKVIANSQTGRHLSKIFSDIDLLARTFYRKDQYLKSKGSEIALAIENIKERSQNPHLTKTVATVANTIDSFLSQCAIVNSYLQASDSIDREAQKDLDNLENTVAGLLIEYTLEGNDKSFAEQLLTLVIGYRETLLQIGKLHAELGNQRFLKPQKGYATPLITAIDDLILRLQTITASIPQVSRHGKALLSHVEEYKATVIRLSGSMEQLGKLMSDFDHAKIRAISELANLDEQISNTAQSLGNDIEEVVTSTKILVLLLSLTIVIIAGLITGYINRSNINKPMKAILQRIDLFAKGKLDQETPEDREDEWGIIEIALSQMAKNLSNSHAALRNSEERYRDLYEAAPNAYFSVSAIDGSIIQCNHTAEKLLGYTRGALTGMKVFDLYTDSPQGFPKAQEVFESFKRGQSISDVELQMQHNDGYPVWIGLSVESTKDSEGNVVESRSMAVDISDRKRVEKLLIENKQLLRSVLDSTFDGILVFNEAGQVLLMNARFVQICRIPQELVEDKDDGMLLKYFLDKLKDPETFLSKLEDLSGTSKEGFYTLFFKDGRVVKGFSRPLIQESGVAGRVCSFVDVTEHKVFEERLREGEERYRIQGDDLRPTPVSN